MQTNVITVPRGSIWWADDKCFPKGEHIQAKTRPVVVVSNDDRGSTSVVEVCTITSTDDKYCCPGINVPFYNDKGEKNYIQTNQHFVINTKDLRNFVGMLSQKALLRFESGLRVAQALPSTGELSEQVSELERQLRSAKLKSCSADVMKAALSHVNVLIKSLTESAERINSTIEDVLSKDAVKSADSVVTKKKNRKWTEELMLEYLDDYDMVVSGELEKAEMCKKWDMKSWSAAYKQKYYIDKKLEVLTA